jgi:hypothetical protein
VNPNPGKILWLVESNSGSVRYDAEPGLEVVEEEPSNVLPAATTKFCASRSLNPHRNPTPHAT